MQLIGIAVVILAVTVLTCRAAPSNTTKPFPSPDRSKRNAPVAGSLQVYVKYGVGLPDRDGFLAGRSDPYVSVTAVNNHGRRLTRNTRHIQGDHSPHWYQTLSFGADWAWHHFEMSAWDSDVGSDDRLSNTEVVHISSGSHTNRVHSCGSGCAVYYDYTLTPDPQNCSPNPCVRGSCTDLLFAYRCNCPSGYGGTRCEHIIGRLRIYVRYGHSLPDRDGWLAGHSDPYVRVVAYDRSGNSRSLQTRHRQGDHSPEWNQWLDFGVGSWSRFSVRVYDKDPGSDDTLSSTRNYYLSSHTSVPHTSMNCDSGYIVFGYYFQ